MKVFMDYERIPLIIKYSGRFFPHEHNFRYPSSRNMALNFQSFITTTSLEKSLQMIREGRLCFHFHKNKGQWGLSKLMNLRIYNKEVVLFNIFGYHRSSFSKQLVELQRISFGKQRNRSTT
jgi:hypothetical protein